MGGRGLRSFGTGGGRSALNGGAAISTNHFARSAQRTISHRSPVQFPPLSEPSATQEFKFTSLSRRSPKAGFLFGTTPQ